MNLEAFLVSLAIAAFRGAGTQLSMHASHLVITQGFIKMQRTADQILILFIPIERRRSSPHLNRWESCKQKGDTITLV